jgi:hypothetical protein
MACGHFRRVSRIERGVKSSCHSRCHSLDPGPALESQSLSLTVTFSARFSTPAAPTIHE